MEIVTETIIPIITLLGVAASIIVFYFKNSSRNEKDHGENEKNIAILMERLSNIQRTLNKAVNNDLQHIDQKLNEVRGIVGKNTERLVVLETKLNDHITHK